MVQAGEHGGKRRWKCNGMVAIFKPAKRKNQTKPKWLSVINKKIKIKIKIKIKLNNKR
jgi:hypothetical protein